MYIYIEVTKIKFPNITVIFIACRKYGCTLLFSRLFYCIKEKMLMETH